MAVADVAGAANVVSDAKWGVVVTSKEADDDVSIVCNWEEVDDDDSVVGT